MKARKSILISTLLMAGCSLVPLPASAAIERDGRTYWTFEETWDLKTAIDNEVATICGHDYGCELDYRFGLLDQPEYRMMGAMMFPSMVYMTAVNPKKETITLFYNDAGDWSTRALTEGGHFSLQEFTTFWVEDEDLNYSILNDARKTRYYADSILSDLAAEGITPLFYGSVERDGENWFEPNKEIEISVAGSGLARNRAGFIHQIGISDGTFVGTFNYSDCLRSPDYRDGMECKLMFAEDGGMWYLPFGVESETEEETVPTEEAVLPVEEETLIDEEPAIVEPQPEEQTSEPIVAEPQPEEQTSEPIVAEPQPEEQAPEPIIIESQLRSQPEEQPDDVALPNADSAVNLASQSSTGYEESGETKSLTQPQKDGRGFLSLVFAIMTAAIIGIVWFVAPVRIKKR